MSESNVEQAKTPESRPGRIESLDQFRGYTVAGMLLVNFLGSYVAVPEILKHHNTYCSYADTIMPHFLFAVGFAFRLTYMKRLATVGRRAANLAVVRRNLGLLLVGFVVYHLDGKVSSWAELRELGVTGFLSTAFQRDYFQTLVHIALTSVWVLPVIASTARVRIAYAVASGLLHLALSWGFYFDFAWSRPVIDGGILGFLTWTFPLLVGSLAFDAVTSQGRKSVLPMLGWSALVMLAGYGVSCVGHFPAAPPFVAPTVPVDLWTMSQRAGSLSYLVFASGFSLAVYAIFVLACDRPNGIRIGLFHTFGTNALVAYILHPLVSQAVKPWLPKDAPGWYVTAIFLIYFMINYLFIRSLEKNRLFLKL